MPRRAQFIFDAIYELDSATLLTMLQLELLTGGRALQTRDEESDTPLHAAIMAYDKAAAPDWLECIRMLLAAGADPNARDVWGHTPLYYAEQACDCSRFCHPESVVQALLAAGGICSAPHHSVNNSP